GWTIVSTNNNELILKYKPVLNGFDTLKTLEGSTVLLPRIYGSTKDYTNPGLPLQLIQKVNITVPGEKNFVLTDWKIISKKFFKGMIAPVPSHKESNGFYNEEYAINSKYFETVSQNWAKLDYSGISRDRYLASLTFNVTKYDAFSESIEIPTEVQFRIKFINNSGNPINTTQDNGNVVSINHFQSENWRIPDNVQSNASKIKKEDSPLALTSSGTWLKITIDNEGVYYIDGESLSQAGVSVPNSDLKTIKIFGNGGKELSEYRDAAKNNVMHEQEIIVKTKPNGDLDKIIFYGSPAFGFEFDGRNFEHYINNYSVNNYYLLTFGGSDGKRATADTVPAGTVESRPLVYTHRIFLEEELFTSFKTGSGRVWFGRNNFPATFTNPLYNLDRNGNIFYRFAVAQRSSFNGSFTISESGTELTKITLSGYGGDAYRSEGKGEIPASSIGSDNRSYLKFSYYNELGGSSATGFLDWFEIHYPRSFVPIDNELSFFSDTAWSGINEITVNGFSGGEILGYNVTNLENPKLLSNQSTTGGLFVMKYNFTKNNPNRFFISSTLKKPVKIEQTEFADLRNNYANADYIVITHPDLLNSAEIYKNYRIQRDSIKTVIVTTNQIYNEFSSGVPDPTAIRDFLAFTMNNWTNKPRYVLLWGKGHYDFKNIESNKINYVPAYESADENSFFDPISSFTTDDFYGRIVGDDRLVDVAIGRITVDSDKLGQWIVEKIKNYENSSSTDPWRTMVTLLADDSYTSEGWDGNAHTSQSEKLSNYFLPSDMQQKKIYLPEYPTENVAGGKRKPRATEEMLSVINTSGTLMLNWIGHGNPRVWAHEELYERSITTPQMVNINKLFFTVAATCDFGRFDMPEVKCGSEEMLNSKVGGAIGVLSATRSVLSGQNSELADNFYQFLFTKDEATNRYPRLGDVIFSLKQQMSDSNDEKFFLLGDPFMRLIIPDYTATVDSIQGINIEPNTGCVTLKALSKVKISGSVLNPDTKQTDNSFNGTVIINMYDADVNLVVLDYDPSQTPHHIQKYGGALNRSSYPVTNGKYTAEFIIPKDISFSTDSGRIFIYAYSNDNKFAKGICRKFILSDIDTLQNPDNQGPDIAVYLDNRKFIKGDYVRKNPLLIVDLFDNSGINTTGLGIGHRIEAWIDDNPNSIDLTQKFTTSSEDSRKGTAEEFLFNLEPGVHRVKIRAWDVFNNYSQASTFFKIADGKEGVIISNIFNYPNPADSYTTFSFNHNVSPPFNAEINIFNTVGQKINSVSGTILTPYNAELSWDCRESGGALIPSGAYPYSVKITTNDGTIKTSSGIMIFLR
ncbi:MAG: type IX secretion system sortase PorU, partial [Bacteroidota bacterium]